MNARHSDSGWRLVASKDEAAPLIATLVDLDPGREYTRSDLAEAADVPLKTLYLVETLEDLVAAGMLDRVEDGEDSEAVYVVDGDSEVLAAARAFDDAVAAQLGE